jgi:hypothetical protein
MKRAARQGFLATGEDTEAVAAVRKTFDDREEVVSYPGAFWSHVPVQEEIER